MIQVSVKYPKRLTSIYKASLTHDKRGSVDKMIHVSSSYTQCNVHFTESEDTENTVLKPA